MKSIVETYNEIGDDFDKTRRVMWPEFDAVKKLIVANLHLGLSDKAESEKLNTKLVQKKLRMLDSGCGNGRMAHYFKDFPITYFGYDGSKTLINNARSWFKKESGSSRLKAHFSIGSLLSKKFTLPFDVILSSAVIHHLPTSELHVSYLIKLFSQLSEDGFLYISAWNLRQPKYESLIDEETHACYVPWGTKKRFYYAFDKNELLKRLTEAGFVTVEEVSSAHNFCFIAWKK